MESYDRRNDQNTNIVQQLCINVHRVAAPSVFQGLIQILHCMAKKKKCLEKGNWEYGSMMWHLLPSADQVRQMTL